MLIDLLERRAVRRSDFLAAITGTIALMPTKLAGQRKTRGTPPPTSLTVGSRTATSITLSWASNASSFAVYLNGVYLVTISQKSFVYAGLTCETSYSLGVKAIISGKPSLLASISASTDTCPPTPGVGDSPPPDAGYLPMGDIVLPGNHLTLPDSAAAALLVSGSTWEPRPLNTKRNNVLVDPAAVAAAFAARPLAVDNNYDDLWDSWLLPRVDGQFQGTTDEIFQWAAFKWGLPDNLLRAVCVRESTWYQYLVYPSERPVVNWGCGDMFGANSAASRAFLDYVAGFGHDYQADFGTGFGPKTYSIVGCMAWQDPSWGVMPNNQNGTFPFARNSTAFAVDYLAGHLRGVYEGWEQWLGNAGPVLGYAAGDIWGAVGSWYSGDWHSDAANGYISRVQAELANLTWLQPDWPGVIHSCDPTYGCPQADGL